MDNLESMDLVAELEKTASELEYLARSGDGIAKVASGAVDAGSIYIESLAHALGVTSDGYR